MGMSVVSSGGPCDSLPQFKFPQKFLFVAAMSFIADFGPEWLKQGLKDLNG